VSDNTSKRISSGSESNSRGSSSVNSKDSSNSSKPRFESHSGLDVVVNDGLFDGSVMEDSQLNGVDDDLLPSSLYVLSDEEEWSEKNRILAKKKVAKKRTRGSSKSADRSTSGDERSTDDYPQVARKTAVERAISEANRLASAKQARLERLEERRCIAYSALSSVSDRQADVDDGGDESSAKKRKARASSGFDKTIVAVYADDYRLTMLNKDMVRGAAEDILGNIVVSGDKNSDINQEVKEAIVRNFKSKLNQSCDHQLKQELMKYMQVEIFKEVTFERLIVAYAVAKRQAVGALDSEIIDIDWFEVISEFGVNLRDRLDKNNDAIMERIHDQIDNCSKFTPSEKVAEKKKYAASMHAFRKHAVRIINKVIHRTINKIGGHWEALNFAEGGLPRHLNYIKKSRGALFAFSAANFSLFSNDNIASVSDVGVDTFMAEICKSNHGDGHMETLIAYNVYAREKYQGHYNISPKNKNDAAEIVARASLPASASVSEVLLPAAGTSGDGISASSAELPAVVEMTDSSLPCVAAAPTLACLSADWSPPSSGPLQKDSFITPNLKRRDASFDFDVTYGVDHSDEDESPESSHDNFRTASAMKAYLKELLSGVNGETPEMVLRLQHVNSTKLKGLLSLLKFLDDNQDLGDDVLFEKFMADQEFTKLLTCSFLIPFQDNDRYNIVPDGYCFYRALFQLLTRARSDDFGSSASEMRQRDESINLCEGGGRREAFHQFFTELEELLPECYGKSRVINAQITFFNLKSYLDEAFWGILDAVAFVDFPCSGFSYYKDKTLQGYWAKYRCSSVFGLINGRDSVVEDSVGCSPSLADVALLLSQEPNFIMHKINHYFVSNHPSQLIFESAFAACVKQMLKELIRRMNVSRPPLRGDADNGDCVSFAGAYSRCEEGTSGKDDERFVRDALVLLSESLKPLRAESQSDCEQYAPPHSTLKSKRVGSVVHVCHDTQYDGNYAMLEQSVRFVSFERMFF
jgi:hypothetical protein